FIRQIVSYVVLLAYMWVVLDAPVVGYALSGRELVNSDLKDLSASQDAKLVPFPTKVHVVMAYDSIASLCRRYNLSKQGFAKLNHDIKHQKLVVGSTVIVPQLPLSDAMSRYFDGNSALAGSLASHAQQLGSSLSNNPTSKAFND